MVDNHHLELGMGARGTRRGTRHGTRHPAAVRPGMVRPGIVLSRASTSFVLALPLRALHVDPAMPLAFTGSYPGNLVVGLVSSSGVDHAARAWDWALSWASIRRSRSSRSVRVNFQLNGLAMAL